MNPVSEAKFNLYNIYDKDCLFDPVIIYSKGAKSNLSKDQVRLLQAQTQFGRHVFRYSFS